MSTLKWSGPSLRCVAWLLCLVGLPFASWAAEPAPPKERAVPFAAGSAVLSPESQAMLQGWARQVGTEAQVTVIGRDDDGSNAALAEARAKMLSAVLRASGLPRAHIVMRQEAGRGGASGQATAFSQVRWKAAPTASSPSPTSSSTAMSARAAPPSDHVGIEPAAPQRFEILVSDGELSHTLRRWGLQHGYRVVWDAPVQAAVQGNMTIEAGGFMEAVGQVIGGLRDAGYPVAAQRQPPNLVRIVAAANR